MSRKKRLGPRRKDKDNKRNEIAMERIGILLKLADTSALKGDLDGADNYIKKARLIGMKCNTRIPSHLKRKFCKYCYSYLLPGKSSKVRINSKNKRVVVKCLRCGREIYFPYVREKKEKRRKKEGKLDRKK